MTIPELATLLAQAKAVIGVDTGLSHLAVALNTPTVAIYTATDPGLTGVFGSGYFKNLGAKAKIPSVQSVIDALKPALG
jgi:heptosyltransferase-1